MPKFIIRTFISTIALVSLVTLFSQTVYGQSGNFTVSQHGHNVGTASYNFEAASNGYTSSSVVRISMQGLDYALSKSEQLSANRELLHVQLNGTVNGAAVTVTGKPDAAQFLLNTSANGRSTTARLATHPATVFLADFDAGALETLLSLAAAHNGRDLWAIIPKRAGSMEPVQLATLADEQGTLNDQPVTVHHQIVTIAGAKTDLFSGPQNQLLQAELPEQGFSMIRNGFVLTPPSKPTEPAAESDEQAPPTQPAQ